MGAFLASLYGLALGSFLWGFRPVAGAETVSALLVLFALFGAAAREVYLMSREE